MPRASRKGRVPAAIFVSWRIWSISRDEGASMRDGRPVGIRYSTVGYDFEGEFLEFDGEFGPERTLAWIFCIRAADGSTRWRRLMR